MPRGRPRRPTPFAAMHAVHHRAGIRVTAKKYGIGYQSLRRAMDDHGVTVEPPARPANFEPPKTGIAEPATACEKESLG